MKTKIAATVNIQVAVECPSCGLGIDLLDENATSGVCHNDDSSILKSVFDNKTRSWEEFEIEDVTCSYCGHNFDVSGLVY